MRWVRRIAMGALVAALMTIVLAWRAQRMGDATFALAGIAITLAIAGLERQQRRAFELRLWTAAAEREALARDLEETRHQLQSMRRERTQVMAGLRHQLRQPLQAVRLSADAMLARQPDPHEADALRQQLRAADDAIGALDRFAEFIEIERGAFPVDLQRVNVREVIESVAAVQRSMHAGEPIAIHTHGRDAWVHSDPMQLRRMVQALMGNAVRQSLRAGQPRHSLVVAAVRPQDEGYCIDIVDNGDGLDREEADRLFEPYAPRANDGSTQEPPGIGLAIVPGLARQLGMRLESVRSRRGRGTRIRILMPATLRWRDET